MLVRTLELAGLGLALGMAGARVLSGALTSLLFGITPGDPATFVAMGMLTGVAADTPGIFPP